MVMLVLDMGTAGEPQERNRMNLEQLKKTAQAMVAPGKGILVLDFRRGLSVLAHVADNRFDDLWHFEVVG